MIWKPREEFVLTKGTSEIVTATLLEEADRSKRDNEAFNLHPSASALFGKDTLGRKHISTQEVDGLLALTGVLQNGAGNENLQRHSGDGRLRAGCLASVRCLKHRNRSISL